MTYESEVTLEFSGEIVDAFNAEDVERILSLFAEDGELFPAVEPEHFGTRLKGCEAIREGLTARFAAVPDIQWREGKHWILGNKALSEWRVPGAPSAGGRLDCPGCDLWDFRNRWTIKKYTYYKQVRG